jgi:hypothetical protein
MLECLLIEQLEVIAYLTYRVELSKTVVWEYYFIREVAAPW